MLPAIAQRHDTGAVLMLARMNRAALPKTLATGRVCCGSRSRGYLWRKGETSWTIQRLKGLQLDGGGDALLSMVEPTGSDCPTGRSRGFHNVLPGKRPEVISQPIQGDQA